MVWAEILEFWAEFLELLGLKSWIFGAEILEFWAKMLEF